MMLKEIINPLHHPIFRYCTGSKIWDKDANKMVQLDLLMIFVRVKNELGHEMAQKAVDLIVKKVTEAYQTLEIKNLNITSQKMVRPVITLGEITFFMTHLSLAKHKDIDLICTQHDAIYVNAKICDKETTIKQIQHCMDKACIDLFNGKITLRTDITVYDEFTGFNPNKTTTSFERIINQLKKVA